MRHHRPQETPPSLPNQNNRVNIIFVPGAVRLHPNFLCWTLWRLALKKTAIEHQRLLVFCVGLAWVWILDSLQTPSACPGRAGDGRFTRGAAPQGNAKSVAPSEGQANPLKVDGQEDLRSLGRQMMAGPPPKAPAHCMHIAFPWPPSAPPSASLSLVTSLLLL